jgi:hypothetical protein
MIAARYAIIPPPAKPIFPKEPAAPTPEEVQKIIKMLGETTPATKADIEAVTKRLDYIENEVLKPLLAAFTAWTKKR